MMDENARLRAALAEVYNLAKLIDVGQSVEPDHWAFRRKARNNASRIIRMVDAALTPAPGADFKAGMLRAAEIADYFAEQDYAAMGYPEDGGIAASGTAHMIRQEVRAEAEKITSSDAGGGAITARATPQPGEVPASSAPTPLTLTPGRRYRDGNGEVKGPLSTILWETGETLFRDAYTLWTADGTLAGGSRDDPRSLVAEVP